MSEDSQRVWSFSVFFRSRETLGFVMRGARGWIESDVVGVLLAGGLDFPVRQAIRGETAQAETQRGGHGYTARRRHSHGAFLASEVTAGTCTCYVHAHAILIRVSVKTRGVLPHGEIGSPASPGRKSARIDWDASLRINIQITQRRVVCATRREFGVGH